MPEPQNAQPRPATRIQYLLIVAMSAIVLVAAFHVAGSSLSATFAHMVHAFG